MEMESGESSAIGGQNESMELPLGFRFDPHPWELVFFYVKPKNFDLPLPIEIPEVDLYEWHPKKLTTEIDSSFGIYGNGRYYYFTKRKRRDRRGSRIKRSTKGGKWKTTSKDKDVKNDNNKKIGHRKTFKFFEGNARKPTNWIMHEFRDLNTKSVIDASTSNENSNRIEHYYVLCMIYEKVKKCPTGVDAFKEVRESSIPQNQSMVCASHPHEGNSLMPNMDQFQLQPYFGNDNGFSTPLEFPDQDVLRHLIEPDGENMHLDFPNTNPSHPHEANSLMPNMDQFQQRPYFENDNGFSTPLEFPDQDVLRHLIEPDGENMHLHFPDTNPSNPHEANSLMPNMDRFQQRPYFGNDNGFSTPLEFPDQDVLRHLIEPDGENMHLHFLDTNPSHPHEANSLMPNMDQFQQQPYFGNGNGFSTPLEFPDQDVLRHQIEPDRESRHLDFPDTNPSHPHEANSLMPDMDQFPLQPYFGDDYGFSLSGIS